MSSRIELPVRGMTCGHCVRTVAAALEQVPGVRKVDVQLEPGLAALELSAPVPREKLVKAIQAAGYSTEAPPPQSELPMLQPTVLPLESLQPTKSSGRQTSPPATDPGERIALDVEGMHCASCTSRVEQALAAVPGVRSAHANLTLGQAAVLADSKSIDREALVAAIERSGYRAALADNSAATLEGVVDRPRRERGAWRNRVVLGTACFAAMLLVMFVLPLSMQAMAWAQLLLATPVQLYVGAPYYRGSWQRLRHGSTNMDTLVALGTTAAYVGGLSTMGAAHEGMYFMDAVLILTFISLGKYLELFARGRASSAIEKLLRLAPETALVERDGRLQEVPSKEVAVGETIVVRPGQRVPLDAEVVAGASAVDQSWLTGESLPVEKEVGDEILAGTINAQGALTARVLRAAGTAALDRIVELVQRAQESKADVQRLADRVVAWFVPFVLLVAVIALIAWTLAGSFAGGYLAAIAVLVVACPCALGLATPTAILVGSGRGAEQGVLVREAHALEIAGRLTTVVLDKTGTVTLGEHRITQILPSDGASEEELLAIAASAERLSNHPLGRPIVAEAERRGLAIASADHLEVVPGAGIRARVEGDSVLVGNERLLTSTQTTAIQATLDELRRGGQTVLAVVRSERLLGVLALADTIASGSREAVDSLKRQGLEVVLLSGDHRAAVEATAREVGIERVLAEVLPEEKQQTIQSLQADGHVVAMVGDGINDAPALVAADLGIAIGSGSDVAIESADIVLVRSDLRGVGQAIALARATLRTIRQNLAWAFGYNIVLIPAAAGLFYPWTGFRLPPIAAAAAMALSSVSVVANSLLLRYRRLDADRR